MEEDSSCFSHRETMVYYTNHPIRKIPKIPQPGETWLEKIPKKQTWLVMMAHG
jgi:hypothetical protein